MLKKSLTKNYLIHKIFRMLVTNILYFINNNMIKWNMNRSIFEKYAFSLFHYHCIASKYEFYEFFNKFLTFSFQFY